ncbi:MAG: fibrobacter succinogenes major paralogous domain-containing protein [Chitinispirillia bacterium]|nr:fibrobacter succinogenes major paralogous domain-containing protein [Chitinispirillia bacterium]MCL2241474.1 fibrobacter succinogenes major paralogous domain-containing protein [Chitinispirillia bacterium]
MNALAGGKSRRAAGRVFVAVAVVLLSVSVSVLLSVPAVNAQGSFTDTRDGKTYRTVKIGKQTWMAENLNYQTGNSVCYDNEESNCQKYGRLYDWNTAMKACPAGWHLPSYLEWTALTDFVGGEKTAGTKLKSKTGWPYKAAATDDYGFSALPGGSGGSGGSFGNAGSYGRWWSATEHDAYNAWYRYMNYYYEYVDRGSYDFKSGLFSLRCSQDSAAQR